MDSSGRDRPSGFTSRLDDPGIEGGSAARALLRAWVDSAAAGLALLTGDGLILWVNRRLLELLGHEEPEALIGTSLSTLRKETPGAAPGPEVLSGSQRSRVWSLRHADDTYSEFRATLAVAPEGALDDVELVLVVEPAARLDDRFRALKANEGRLYALIEASPLGIDVMDREGHPVFYNPMAEELHGIPFETAARRGWTEAVHPDDRARVVASWYEAARAGRSWEEMYRFVHPDGRTVWVSGRAAPIRVDGEMIGFVGTLEDITALKSAEAELSELLERERLARGQAERRVREEEALRRAAAAVAETSTTVDAARAIARGALAATDADDALVERIAGDARRVVIEAAAGRRLPANGMSIPYEGSLTQQVVEGSSPVLVERLADVSHRVPREIATLHDSALAVPLRGRGRPLGALILLRRPEQPPFEPVDLARARLFADLAALAFANIQLLEESVERTQEIEGMMESRARLIRGFSHDVRNPLGGADGYLSLLEEGIGGALPDPQLEKVKRARGAIANAVALLEDLLESAHAEAERITVRWAPTDVRGTVREVGEAYRGRAAEKGLDFDVSLPAHLPLLRSDSGRIRQVLANLLSNAVKYTARGRIEVAVATRSGDEAPGPGEWISIEVRDTGAGIPHQMQHLLFRAFVRLDPGTEHGAGVGLVISRMTAEALGGRITVSSEPGSGSVFTLWLPRATSTEDDGGQ